MSDNSPDFSAALEKLQSMMSTEDGQNQLGDLLSSFLGNTGGGSVNSETTSSPPNQQATNNNAGGADMGNLEMMLKMQKAFALLNNNPSKHADFLRAISPYLSEERRSKLNQAVKFMGIGKIISAMKDLE